MLPPSARREPRRRRIHGHSLLDEFGWLRDRDDPDTIAYLEAENAFTREATSHLAGLRDEIFEEIRSRVQESDLTAPARRDGWWYATRTEEGRQYPIHVRMEGAPDGPEQVLLDVNRLAEGHEHLGLGVFSVSPDHSLLAYSTDTTGGETFTLRFRDLTTGEDLADAIEGTYYSSAWSADGAHLYYTTLDAAHRPYRVWRHRLGTSPADDLLVLEEPDDRFYLSLGTTQDRRYVLADLRSQTTSEVQWLPTDRLDQPFRPVLPRRDGVEYTVDHSRGRWMVVTNDGAVDGRLLSVALDDPPDVVEVLAGEEGRKLSGVTAFSGHVVVTGRRQGRTTVTVLPLEGGEEHDLDFPEEVHTVGLEQNLEYDTTVVRISYQSLVTPPTVIDVDLADGTRTVVKQMPVLGGYDPARYLSRRLWATAGDGTKVPISLVQRADLTHPSPTLLYGYGSYETSIDPWFSIPRLSLLDRGVAFAIAHVRGGGELGKRWYEAGKLARKENTFTDFVACAEHLIAEGYTTPDLLAARGASAGGLLMGAVANLRPDLFRAIVAEVPFVDVLNTMLDESLPLTVIEWEEWGNPNRAEDFGWMLSYSPYDNVRAAEYPAMLVTAGLNDPRVAFWEPAKWVAKLRATAKSRGPLLLKTEMGAGHGGRSGRYDAWREEAFVLAFLLDQWGLTPG